MSLTVITVIEVVVAVVVAVAAGVEAHEGGAAEEGLVEAANTTTSTMPLGSSSSPNASMMEASGP